VHDTTQLEEMGLPSVFVASCEFQDAAESQSKSLGSSPEVVYVRHPIQDRDDDEMGEIADQAVDALVSALTN